MRTSSHISANYSRYVFRLILPVIFLALVSGALIKFPILGAAPLVGLVISVMLATMGGKTDFYFFSLVLGIMTDMVSSGEFGQFTFGFLLVGLVVKLFLSLFAWNKHSITTVLGLVGFCSAMFFVWRYIFFFLSHNVLNQVWITVPSFSYSFMLGQIIYNVLLALIFLFVLDRTGILSDAESF